VLPPQLAESEYAERVYAGVLGKIIGVYLGRPFEQWHHDRIMSELGEIEYYVHDRLGVPLVVTDDDISGTFTFLRALADYGYDPNLTPEQIGQTWLNYIIENRTILWWGGMGMSTEHTAFLRLKEGIPAPDSGTIARNGATVAEQIGAQIFIDGWGMICPNDPDRAVDFARRAGSVSHDGEAIYGAQVVAAMEALAFSGASIDQLIDGALARIPADCLIARMIANIREWHAVGFDWRTAYRNIERVYGYEQYGGGCHIVPNHALIIHALLYGEGDFGRSLQIVNSCGYDTDCNSGNVGCILGIRTGLAGIDGPLDWRGAGRRPDVPTHRRRWARDHRRGGGGAPHCRRRQGGSGRDNLSTAPLLFPVPRLGAGVCGVRRGARERGDGPSDSTYGKWILPCLEPDLHAARGPKGGRLHALRFTDAATGADRSRPDCGPVGVNCKSHVVSLRPRRPARDAARRSRGPFGRRNA